jgi:hypothetical protein
MAGENMQATTPITTPHASQDWAEVSRHTLENVRERAQGLDTQLRTFAREKPLAAMLCALAGGYVLARLSTWR